MQYVVPSPKMGLKRRHAEAPVYSLSELPPEESEHLCDATIAASPQVERLASAACGRIPNRALAARGRYLLRDTLKVHGSPTLNLAPAILALFYVDLTDPEAGGTGHTIRVCRQQGIAVVFQDAFLGWSG